MNPKNKNKYKIILMASFVLFSFFFSSRIIFAKNGIPAPGESPTSGTGGIPSPVPPGAGGSGTGGGAGNGGGLSNNDSSNTYKLLAPLGSKYTEVKTDNIGEYFNKFFELAIGLAGVLAVIMIVIGGVQWMGSESIFGKTEGKKKVTQAVLGLLIALGSYALLNTINPDLLGGKGLQINQVGGDKKTKKTGLNIINKDKGTNKKIKTN